MQFTYAGYTFLHQASSERTNLARDRLSFILCVAGRTLEITSGGDRRVWKIPWHALHGSDRVTPRRFPVHRHGRWPANAQSHQNPSLRESDKTCAAPNLVIVQRRPPRACAVPTPAFSLMSVKFRSLCHGLHTLGPFFHLQCQQPCAK